MKQKSKLADAVLTGLFGPEQPNPAADDLAPGEKVVLPVIEEKVEVSKRRVATGKVRIQKQVSERTEIVDEPLLQEEVTVERVPIRRVIHAPLPIRYEGDTMIVPLIEEVVVVTKQLVLKEELRITRRQVSVHQPQSVTLRREEANIERVSGPAAQGKPSKKDQDSKKSRQKG